MTDKFSIYNSPLSDEAKKIRRNSVLASELCLFIGITAEIPKKFALLGIGFESPQQQNTLGWFLFSVTVYFLIHFISVAGVEVAKWMHPFYKDVIAKQELRSHSDLDEEDFFNNHAPSKGQRQDKHQIQLRNRINWHSECEAERKLMPLYWLIYLQLLIEIVIPIAIGSYGLYKLAQLITSLSSVSA